MRAHTVAALLGLSLLAGACGEPRSPWPGVDVARVRRLGDLPPAAATVTVAVTCDGKIAVDGVPGTEDEARERFGARIVEGLDDRNRRSDRNVVLALDASLPWSVAESFAIWAARSRTGALFFAVMTVDGAEEGAVAAWLPRDSCGGKALAARTDLWIRDAEIAVDEGTDEPLRYLEPLRAVVAERGADKVFVSVAPKRDASVGLVLRTVDVILLAGAQFGGFRYAADSPDEEPGTGIALPMRVSIRGLVPSRDLPEAPRSSRTRRAYVGDTTSVRVPDAPIDPCPAEE